MRSRRTKRGASAGTDVRRRRGTHTLHLDVDAEGVQVWVNGAEAAVRDGQVRLEVPAADVSQVALRVEQKAGVYAGAAISSL